MIARIAREVREVDFTGIGLFDSERRLRMVASCGNDSQEWSALIISAGDGVAGNVQRLRRPVVVDDYGRESGSTPVLISTFCDRERGGSLAAFPIFRGKMLSGVFYAARRTPLRSDERTLRILADVADLLSVWQTGDDDPEEVRSGQAKPPTKVVQLSPREIKMVELLSNGLDTRAIANRESLAVNSVRTYIQSVITKLNSHNRLEAVARARSLGLIA